MPQYQVFDEEDKIIETTKVTTGYFSDGGGTLTGANMISQSLTASQEQYYANVRKTGTTNDEFSVTTAGTEMLQIDGTGTTFNVNAQDRDFKVSGNGGNLFLLNDGSNRAVFPTITEFRIGQADATAAATLDVAGNIFTSGSDVGHITASGNISSSGGTGSFGSLKVDGSSVDFSGLPTSDPGVAGRLYNDSGTIKISL